MNPSPATRTTKARTAIVRILQAHPDPISLADLHSYLKISYPEIAYSTVFRQVTKLEQEGKAVRIDWRERGSRYEWADRPHHHHIVCQACGAIVDLDCDLFKFREDEVGKATGFTVRRHSIEFEGICPACQAVSARR